jgi:hypothetical protein
MRCPRFRKSIAIGLAPALFLAGACFSAVARAQFAASDEYALIGYENEAKDNPIARLQEDLKGGKVHLDYAKLRGYFDALVDALDIDADSQMLVFSPTSLQKDLISPERPRGLFFNDNTYLGLVQKSHIVEVVTLDEKQGIVFYTFDNTEGTTTYFQRQNQTCLVCHDTQGTSGSGVPMLMALSTVYSKQNVPLETVSGTGNVGDETPIEDRWGGWYVTGRHGLQPHLGNLRLDGRDELESLDDYRVWNVESLQAAGYLDTSPYPRDTSDIVALMVLEHQITVQNQITYIRFKAPAVLKRRGMGGAMTASSWDALPWEAQQTLGPMMDKLVERLVLFDAAGFASRISGSQAFVEDFTARGPRDGAGRSLRDLDLTRRLFRYPLSYLIYTENFATLPAYAKDYVYRRLAAYLEGEEIFAGNSRYSLDDRRAALEILAATEPEFVPYLAPSRRSPAVDHAKEASWH